MNTTPPLPLDLGSRGTPLHAADQLGLALGLNAGALWIKRDDLTGLAAGGNKARKLEYVCGEAVTIGANVLVTGGSMPQSNQIGPAAAAANRIGMRIRVVLPGTPPDHLDGNLLINHMMGVEYTWLDGIPTEGMDWAIRAEAKQLKAQGHRPYVLPLGVSSALGAMGYVEAAVEIEDQAPPDSIVYTASGTGGTQAGLAVGLGNHDRVRGVNTGSPWDLTATVNELAIDTAELAGLPQPLGEAQVLDDFVGPGYGLPTEEAREAVLLLARTEGILSEPIYTGKALAALISDCRAGRIASDQPTVFLHTGGLPLLYTQQNATWLTEAQ